MIDQSTRILRRVTLEEWRADRDYPHASYGEREIRVAERVQERTGLPYMRCERAAHLLYNLSRGVGRPIDDEELAAKPWDKEPPLPSERPVVWVGPESIKRAEEILARRAQAAGEAYAAVSERVRSALGPRG